MCDKKGGNILASGGFGCVFSPPLKCENEKSQDKNKLSKLMLEKYAVQEYEEINKIREKLQYIPNYKNYFLLDDFTICKPGKLNKEDLSNYTKKCSALKKNGIKKNNINKKLKELMILNMPNGGIPIDDYISEYGSFKNLFTLNNLLIDLLMNAIIPMNHKNIYHCDIKDSNVLIDLKNNENNVRLIDWGLTTEYIPFKNNKFPRTFRNRPLQFNVPFSVIIFTDDFVKKYTNYIEKGGNIDENELRPFLLDYIYYWFKERGHGHYKFINEIMYALFGNELNNIDKEEKYKIIENEFTMTYILNYIIEILIHFTEFREDGTLNLRRYLDNVFINIVDIWGFLTLYIPILIIFNENYDELDFKQKKIFDLLKNILIKYLYSPRIEVINISNLVKELKELGELFRSENKNQYKKKYVTKNNNNKNKNRTKKIHFGKTRKNKFKSFLMITEKNKKIKK